MARHRLPGRHETTPVVRRTIEMVDTAGTAHFLTIDAAGRRAPPGPVHRDVPRGDLARSARRPQGSPVPAVHSHPHAEGYAMTVEQSHRFALTGQDPEGRNRTIILWQEADLVDGKVQRRVVVTLDATMNTATVLTRSQAIQVAQAMLAAAR
jgi:hypothetical protein